jgi:hypothetical protein
MGTGEWWAIATCIERTKQTDDQSERTFREPQDRVTTLLGDESEIEGYPEVTVQLCGRAERYAQASHELPGRAERVTLNHVGRDGRRGSTDLVGQSEVPIQWFLERQRIGRAGQSLGAFPGLQCFELLHVGKMDVGLGGGGTIIVRQDISSPRAPFPIPRSPSFP